MSRIFQEHRKLYIGKTRQIDDPRIKHGRSQGCLQAWLSVRTRNRHLGHHDPLSPLQDCANHLKIFIGGIGRTKKVRIHRHGGILTPQRINRPRTGRISQSKQEASVHRANVIATVWTRVGMHNKTTFFSRNKFRSIKAADIGDVFFAICINPWIEHSTPIQHFVTPRYHYRLSQSYQQNPSYHSIRHRKGKPCEH